MFSNCASKVRTLSYCICLTAEQLLFTLFLHATTLVSVVYELKVLDKLIEQPALLVTGPLKPTILKI